MKHWTATKVGGLNALNLAKLPQLDATQLAPDTALLRHFSAIISFTDAKIVEGSYFRSYPAPITPGYSFIGVVEALGPESKNPYPRGCPPLQKGDLVACMNSIGGWATHSIQPTKNPLKSIVKVPFPISRFPSNAAEDNTSSINLAQLTSLILNTTTAKQMLNKISVPMNSGDFVLVHSIAGGVGTALMELIHLEYPGVKVIGTCSAAKMDFVKQRGGLPIDYRAEKFEEGVARILKEQNSSATGVRVAFDGVGGDNLGRSYACLACNVPSELLGYGDTGGGGLVGPLAGQLIKNLNVFSNKKTSFFGVILEKEKKPEVFAKDLITLVGYLDQGKIDPFVEAVVDVDHIDKALEYVKQGKSKGNIVAIIDQEIAANFKHTLRYEFHNTTGIHIILVFPPSFILWPTAQQNQNLFSRGICVFYFLLLPHHAIPTKEFPRSP